jgi:hypothetical protein
VFYLHVWTVTTFYQLLRGSDKYNLFIHGFVPGFLNHKKGALDSKPQVIKVYQLLAHGQWISPGTPASSTTKKVALNTCPTIFLSRRQYACFQCFLLSSFFLSCIDNATSYQTACCGVIDNVAILHWLNIISYAYHHDMFVN